MVCRIFPVKFNLCNKYNKEGKGERVYGYTIGTSAWVPVGSRHGCRHPQVQNASTVSNLEEGGPVCDLSGPAQGI